MDVQLYVYDLSKGLARQISASLLGTQIDAVYHTSVVFGGVEYFFGGGIQTSYPGRTHHGAPMEVVNLGQTQLPMEVILEYLESLKAIYTMESYDLFLHNCNNFTNDFSMFLVGKSIPSHITSLPQTVLDTPFGQMLRPQLDKAMRGVTQAPVPPSEVPPADRSARGSASGNTASHMPGIVYRPTTLAQLDELLASARNSCAVIFFTSATCPPCKLVYPAYDELAASAGNKAFLIKVDVSEAYEIGAKYQVRATPTFMTYLKGEKENEWSGANESQLRGNINLLIQMAHPTHPHAQIRVPTLQKSHTKPITYPKVPPLDKLVAKLGATSTEPAVKTLKDFNTARIESGAIDAPLPSLPEISDFMVNSTQNLPPEKLFPLIDLFRLALMDPRVSGYFTQDTKPFSTILSKIDRMGIECPYQLRIVTLHMACNFFTSPMFPTQALTHEELSNLLLQLITSSLLDVAHPQVRVVAAQLAFNVAAANHIQRLDHKSDIITEGGQVELMAGLLEGMRREGSSVDVVRGLLLAIGLLKYLAPTVGEVSDLCEAVDAKHLVSETKTKFNELKELAREVELVMA